MPITRTYEPSPLLMGAAALQLGQQEADRYAQQQAFRDQQLAEQQRQFDERNALAQQQIGLEKQGQGWRQQFAYDQLRQQGQQFNLGLYDRQGARQDQLAAQDMQGPYGLMGNLFQQPGVAARQKTWRQGQR